MYKRRPPPSAKPRATEHDVRAIKRRLRRKPKRHRTRGPKRRENAGPPMEEVGTDPETGETLYEPLEYEVPYFNQFDLPDAIEMEETMEAAILKAIQDGKKVFSVGIGEREDEELTPEDKAYLEAWAYVAENVGYPLSGWFYDPTRYAITDPFTPVSGPDEDEGEDWEIGAAVASFLHFDWTTKPDDPYYHDMTTLAEEVEAAIDAELIDPYAEVKESTVEFATVIGKAAAASGIDLGPDDGEALLVIGEVLWSNPDSITPESVATVLPWLSDAMLAESTPSGVTFSELGEVYHDTVQDLQDRYDAIAEEAGEAAYHTLTTQRPDLIERFTTMMATSLTARRYHPKSRAYREHFDAVEYRFTQALQRDMPEKVRTTLGGYLAQSIEEALLDGRLEQA